MWCNKLKQDVFSTQEFKEQSKYFVFVHIDADSEKGLMDQFGVQGIPDIRFLKADGTQVHRIGGFEPTGEFIADMDKARQKAAG